MNVSTYSLNFHRIRICRNCLKTHIHLRFWSSPRTYYDTRSSSDRLLKLSGLWRRLQQTHLMRWRFGWPRRMHLIVFLRRTQPRHIFRQHLPDTFGQLSMAVITSFSATLISTLSLSASIHVRALLAEIILPHLTQTCRVSNWRLST